MSITTDSFVLFCIFRPLPGKADEVREALGRVVPKLHEEEGNAYFALHGNDDGTIVLVEAWKDEAAMDKHAASSPNIDELRAAFRDKLASPLEVIKTRPLPFGTPEQGML
jgi:quinol monooxygenase YgiN